MERPHPRRTHDAAAVALTLASVWISDRTRINPLCAMGAVLGMAGLV